jgi:hypothetical protein
MAVSTHGNAFLIQILTSLKKSLIFAKPFRDFMICILPKLLKASKSYKFTAIKLKG